MKVCFGNEEYDHIVSFRRQLYIHPNDNEKISSSILINLNQTDYRLFLFDDTVICYFCKQTTAKTSTQIKHQPVTTKTHLFPSTIRTHNFTLRKLQIHSMPLQTQIQLLNQILTI